MKMRRREEVIREEMDGEDHRRPKLFWFNLALTLGLLGLLIGGSIPLVILFMLRLRDRRCGQLSQSAATEGAYRGARRQCDGDRQPGVRRGHLHRHIVGDEDGRCDGGIGGRHHPAALGPYMAPITALVSIPFTVLISNDAFYFGMLPVLGQTGVNMA
jgi:CitMHS family citrate-Mg2+:H+ or citrate-Ca2+:H+ symporter